jgi:hypothetical protein
MKASLLLGFARNSLVEDGDERFGNRYDAGEVCVFGYDAPGFLSSQNLS